MVAVAAAPVAGSPSDPNRNGLLAYDAWDGIQHTIQVVVATGGTPRALAPESTDDPSWSPDGSLIAHSVENAPNACQYCWEIFVTRADGFGSRQLTRGGTNGNPSWSPDGRLIAYSHNDNVIDAPTEIWVVSPNGKRARRLATSSRGRDFFGTTAWSPNGKTLAVTASGLYLVGTDGRDLRRLTKLDASFPRFSPSGKLIAFNHSTRLPGRRIRNDIYLIGVDGKGVHRLGDTRIQRSEPSWSPDGKRLAFVGSTNPQVAPYSSGIYTVSIDGTRQQRLTSGETAQSPTWSPDGKLIAFTAPHGSGSFGNDDWDVLVMSRDGSGVRTVSGSHYAWASSYVLWQPHP